MGMPGQKTTSQEIRDRGDQAKATFASRFSKPVSAILDGGESVKLTHVGNVEGMSPAYLVVDAQGKSFWVSQSAATIIDPDYLPNEQALKNIQDLTSRRSNR